MTSYHCYIGYHEATYSVDVEAENPEQAAKLAATREHISGCWAVIPGVPIYVKVAEYRIYQVQADA